MGKYLVKVIDWVIIGFNIYGSVCLFIVMLGAFLRSQGGNFLTSI